MSIEASTPHEKPASSRLWRRIRLGLYVSAGLLLLALLVVVGTNMAFGPGVAGLNHLNQLLTGAQLPSAILRAAFGVAALLLWPRLLRKRAERDGWSDAHLASTVIRDRIFIGAALLFDVLVLNLPLWLNLFRGG